MLTLSRPPSSVNTADTQDYATTIPRAYLDRAMSSSTSEKLEDGSWFVEIPEFDGVWADGPSEVDAKVALESVLIDWLVLKIVAHDGDIPIVSEMDLNA